MFNKCPQFLQTKITIATYATCTCKAALALKCDWYYVSGKKSDS